MRCFSPGLGPTFRCSEWTFENPSSSISPETHDFSPATFSSVRFGRRSRRSTSCTRSSASSTSMTTSPWQKRWSTAWSPEAMPTSRCRSRIESEQSDPALCENERRCSATCDPATTTFGCGGSPRHLELEVVSTAGAFWSPLAAHRLGRLREVRRCARASLAKHPRPRAASTCVPSLPANRNEAIAIKMLARKPL